MEHKGSIKGMKSAKQDPKDKLYTYDEMQEIIKEEKAKAVSKALYNNEKKNGRENLIKDVLPSMLIYKDSSFNKLCKDEGITIQEMKCLLIAYIYYNYYKNNSPYFTSIDLHLMSRETKYKLTKLLKDLCDKGYFDYVGLGNYRKRKKISPSRLKNYAMNAKGGEVIRKLSLSIQAEFKLGLESVEKDWLARPKY